jgi:hypothetical protein
MIPHRLLGGKNRAGRQFPSLEFLAILLSLDLRGSRGTQEVNALFDGIQVLIRTMLAVNNDRLTTPSKYTLSMIYIHRVHPIELFLLTIYAKARHDNIPVHILKTLKDRFADDFEA